MSTWRELAERLDRRRIVVLYDSRSALVPFCDRELPPADETHVGASPLLRMGEDVGEGPEQACESKDNHAVQRLGGVSLTVVRADRVVARSARIDGSVIGQRAAVEPFAGVPHPDSLVVYPSMSHGFGPAEPWLDPEPFPGPPLLRSWTIPEK